jgi:hypothetical protein
MNRLMKIRTGKRSALTRPSTLMQESNEKKLDEMRKTVDENLRKRSISA